MQDSRFVVSRYRDLCKSNRCFSCAYSFFPERGPDEPILLEVFPESLSLPYTQDFEGGDLLSLNWWSPCEGRDTFAFFSAIRAMETEKEQVPIILQEAQGLMKFETGLSLLLLIFLGKTG